MDAYQSLGVFVIITMFLLGSAGTLLCAGYGAWMLKKQWESGFDWVSPPTKQEREAIDYHLTDCPKCGAIGVATPDGSGIRRHRAPYSTASECTGV